MTAALDQAYELLRSKGPEYGPLGLSNHGPMAVEAIATVGRDDAILPWLERYGQLLGPQPPARGEIAEQNWSSQLGVLERHTDWAMFFERQLADHPWQNVLNTWAARLAPGMAGAALHGLLRAAHAVRAVAASDTPLRRAELAQGLAYWAASFQKLPGDPDRAGKLSPAAAIAAIELLPLDRRPGFGLITVALEQLGSFVPFRAVAAMLDIHARASEDVLADLTEVFARAYLANASPTNLIAVIHMLTGPSAVRLLLPHVEPDTGRALVGYAWQSGAALFSAFAVTKDAPRIDPHPPSAHDLFDRALQVADEHAIKFTEACLREEKARPIPLFRAAADDVIRRMAAQSS